MKTAVNGPSHPCWTLDGIDHKWLYSKPMGKHRLSASRKCRRCGEKQYLNPCGD